MFRNGWLSSCLPEGTKSLGDLELQLYLHVVPAPLYIKQDFVGSSRSLIVPNDITWKENATRVPDDKLLRKILKFNSPSKQDWATFL